MDDLSGLVDESFCYVTTRGRRTGRPHRIEIWFGWDSGRTIYLLAGGGEKADWVANMRANPEVEVHLGGNDFTGVARIVEEGPEEQLARRLLAEKYQGWEEGDEMSGWAQTALVVAIDLS